MKPGTQVAPELAQAIEEQQKRVWTLASLLHAIEPVVAEIRDQEVDLLAVLSGLRQMAEEIHLALDVGGLVREAERIRTEQAAELQA